VRSQIQEAITLHIESLRKYNEPVPQPGEWTELVEAGQSAGAEQGRMPVQADRRVGH
jgi:hypothetical protein